MTQETTNNQNSIFIEIDKTIKVIGQERLFDILRFSRKNKTTITEEQIIQSRNIIDIVCDEFSMTTDELFSKSRTTNRKYVVGICAFLIYKKLNLSNSDISFILKKESNQVSMYRKEITMLKENSKFDAKILKKLSNINNTLNRQEND